MDNRIEKIEYFDFLNVISCIAVVFLHMNSGSWNYSNTLMWKQALEIEVICYFAVPVFFMLSGATLMNYRKKYTTKQFLQKRAIKILIPYLVWSALYYFINVMTGNEEFSIKTLIESFTAYKAQPIFWFLQAVFNIYFCMPLLSVISEKKYDSLRWYIIGVGVITRFILPLVSSSFSIEFGNYYGLFCADGVLLYALIGFELSQVNFSRNKTYVFMLLGALAIIVRYFGTIIYSYNKGALDTTFYGYTTIWALLPAVGVFLAVKALPYHRINEKFKRFISKLSSYSFGVYLIHLFVIAVFQKLSGIRNSSMLFRLGTPWIIYLICCFVVYIIKKIPFVRRIVP